MWQVPFRRRRYIVITVIGILVWLLYLSPPSSLDKSPLPGPAFGPRPKPGTGLLDSQDWGSDYIADDELEHGKGAWFKTNKGRTILVTGGAGSLAHSTIPLLLESGYSVHALDIVPRPKTLPSQVKYHRVNLIGDKSAESLHQLFSSNNYAGVLHFAAISLEAWCAPRIDTCRKVNHGGTEAVVREIGQIITKIRKQKSPLSLTKSRTATAPWVIYGSSTDVYGPSEQGVITEDTAHNPVTALGKTKEEGEQVVRDAFLQYNEGNIVDPNSNGDQDGDMDTYKVGMATQPAPLNAAIVRLADIYGYDRSVAIPSSFVRSSIRNAVTSLPIQYSSDVTPMDLVYHKEAAQGVFSVVKHMDDAARSRESPRLWEFNLVSGQKRWPQEEIVELVRAETESLSPVIDLGQHKSTSKNTAMMSYERAKTVLGWEPLIAAPHGLALAMSELAQEAVKHMSDFIDEHCDTSPEKLLTPEDERNRELFRLDGCTVNVGFEANNWLNHVKCQDGKHCTADINKVDSYNWNQSVFILRTQMSDSQKRPNGRARVMFEEEKGTGFWGLRKSDASLLGAPVQFELFQPNRSNTEDHVATFDLEVAPTKSWLSLMLAGESTGGQSFRRQIVSKPSPDDPHQAAFEIIQVHTEDEPIYDMRMTILCCPSEGDWPLLLDDHESADVRYGHTGDIPFNSSRRLHLCERANDAKAYYTARVDAASRAIEDAKAGKIDPHRKEQKLSEMPDDWKLKQLAPCWNDCSSPTICVQTGKCRCVQADDCARGRENPLIPLERGVATLKEEDSNKSPLGKLKGFGDTLSQDVAKVNWRDILLPAARAYLDSFPDFIKVHVADNYPKHDEVESKGCHTLKHSHCFSADSMMYKALRKLSVPIEQADLIVLPVYQQCKDVDHEEENAPFLLHDVYHYAHEAAKGNIDKPGGKRVAFVMTHDWAICQAFTWEIWSARQDNKLYPDPLNKNHIVWSVMGDWDSPCYRPAQDIVIPARSCRSIQLVDTFPTPAQIRPVSERPKLLTWSGTFWGTGKTERLRLTCHRGGISDEELVTGGGPMSSFYDWDYMKNLNDARFCPQPKGIAGWSPRINDAIWAGCIPVFIGEGTHYPFADFIDWSLISVRVHQTNLDHIEQILASIPLEKIQTMQANLVAIRQAFIWATDEHPEDELSRRGPMFFALHEAGMRMRMRYPTENWAL